MANAQVQDGERSRGLRVASVGGVPVYVGASWLVMAVIIIATIGPSVAGQRPDLGLRGYGVAALFALELLVAVLVHEAAHAVAARAFGLPVHRVVADLWGGHTAFDASRSTPGVSAVVAVVGPVANGILALVAHAFQDAAPPGVPRSLVGAFALLNAALGAFNLLPGLPLDGGQLVDAAVWKATGNRNKGMVVAGWSGRVVTVLVILWFLGRPLLSGGGLDVVNVIWALFIASFLWAGATSAIRAGTALETLGGVRLAHVLRPAVGAPAETPLGRALSPGAVPVVLDERGRPVALVSWEDAQLVPEAARDFTTLGSVCRAQPPGWVVEADPSGDIVPVVLALQELATGVVAVTQDGRLLGLVTTADVNAALAPR